MPDAFTQVARLLKKLTQPELLAVVTLARGLGGISDSTKRWRKHRDAVFEQTLAPAVNPVLDPTLDKTLVDNVVSAVVSVSLNGTHLRENAKTVLLFLNDKTGRNYRLVDTNLRLIEARLKSGASVQDCKSVIAKKARDWREDSQMMTYLRPATLFNATKFEQYIGELGAGGPS